MNSIHSVLSSAAKQLMNEADNDIQRGHYMHAILVVAQTCEEKMQQMHLSLLKQMTENMKKIKEEQERQTKKKENISH